MLCNLKYNDNISFPVEFIANRLFASHVYGLILLRDFLIFKIFRYSASVDFFYTDIQQNFMG